MAIVVPIVAELNKTGFRQTLAEFRKLETRAQKFQFVMAKATSPAGLASIGAAATTAAYAIYDMAQAAADDQKSQTILATALRNTTGATDAQIASVEELITSMQMAAGISDTELRTGFQNLARATRDVEQSQRLLALATDISVGTGRDLGSVTTALSRAYQGQFGALTRLGIPIDQNIIKTKDFNAVTGILADTFGGSAANAADTYAGKMAITTEKINEANESIGAALIPAIESLVDILAPAADGVTKLADALTYLKDKAEEVSPALGGLFKLLNPLNLFNMGKAAGGGYDLADALEKTGGASNGIFDVFRQITSAIPQVDRSFKSLGGTVKELETPLERFLRSVGETAAEIRSELANTFNLSAIYQEAGGKFKPFMKSFVAQARQFSQYAQNLVKLRSMGLGDVAIRQILSMDLATGSQFAADLLQQSDALKSIATINAGFAGVAALSSATGNILATPNTGGGNIYVTVTSADPNAVVDALRRYQKRNGYVPITVAA